jgi:HEAT repeat protein
VAGAIALSLVGGEHAMRLLERLLHSPLDWVREAATESLSAIREGREHRDLAPRD